tara:strand:- start:16231 stop:17292 length:1062 start_codon:yes stop_codon:yes gene_type:complete
MKKIKRKWKKLLKEDRFNIPINYLKIDESEIKRIRKIKDSKQRLMEAAKIQYELFKDIHTDVTAWIAGYCSDSTVRYNFGSSKKLRDKFFPAQNYQDITPSWMDIKRNIKLPSEIDEKLAEETGIHIGDGNLFVETHKDGSGLSYHCSFHGDLINEVQYHEEHVTSLVKELYNIIPNFARREKKNSIATLCKSKALVLFKNKTLGLPIGKKTDITIPQKIMNNFNLQKNCLVGIFDTDFSLQKYRLSGSMSSIKLMKQIHYILDKHNIHHKFKLFPTYGRILIPKKGAVKIIEEWKLNNIKHLSKYELYKQFGKYIPFSTTPERQAVLEGELELTALERICKKRKKRKKLGRA